MSAVINIAEKLAQFTDHWSPKIVGQVNDCEIKLANIKGEFVWQSHEHADEMFLVIKGRLRMNLRDRELIVNEGEFVIIPHGVEHMPIADEEVHIMLFEPKGTLNTGNLTNERTVHTPERI